MRFYTLPLAALLTLGLCGAAMAADTMSGPAMHAMTNSMSSAGKTSAKTGPMMHPTKKHWMKKQAMKKKHRKMAMHKQTGTMAMHSNSMTGPKGQ